MEILCTVGPSTLSEQNLVKLSQLGVSLFRINLSHTKLEDLEGIIEQIRSCSAVPICLDTEGAQIRTGDFEGVSFRLIENQKVLIPREKVIGNDQCFNFYPLDILDQFEVGDLISIDFNSVLAHVIDKGSDFIQIKVINGGVIGRNKAVSIDRILKMAAMTEKDIAAMAIGRRLAIRNVALSFANSKDDVDEIRKHCLPGARIISKVECLNALRNLDGIIHGSDAILIDRGDLSREVPIETVPFYQKEIIQKAKAFGKKVYVATNLLESMVVSPTPTRAEVNDVYNTIQDGAAGLVLAAETAIGRFPVECVAMVKKVYLNSASPNSIDEKLRSNKDLLIDAHGGALVQSFTSLTPGDLSKRKSIKVDYESLLDIEQIAHGVYSPLTGFLGKRDFESVLHENRLNSGIPWTLPVIFQVTPDQAPNMRVGEAVIICNGSGEAHSLFDIQEIYRVEWEQVLPMWFGTLDPEHPGIKKLMKKGSVFAAGRVMLLDERSYQNSRFSFTPKQIRSVFLKKGWRQVVGFHTRNLPHKAHEFIQSESLLRTFAEGLLISPVLGPKKKGDFCEDIILDAYDISIKNGHFPREKTFLSGFNSYSRFAGPREAIFTAICRQNMGCSFFIVGRDHTGVGSYYSPYASQEYFQKVPGLEIKPVFFEEIAYDPKRAGFCEAVKDGAFFRLSGTELRSLIEQGAEVPDWFLRPEIFEFLMQQRASGRPLFSGE